MHVSIGKAGHLPGSRYFAQHLDHLPLPKLRPASNCSICENRYMERNCCITLCILYQTLRYLQLSVCRHYDDASRQAAYLAALVRKMTSIMINTPISLITPEPAKMDAHNDF